MNWQQLQAVVWLRWRLLVNHGGGPVRDRGAHGDRDRRRLGDGDSTLHRLVCDRSVCDSQAAPAHLDVRLGRSTACVSVFLERGVVTELQRTEPLSLAKFMHLPVSVTGAFLINYLSSLLRFSLVFFGPIMLGFALALVFVKGILLVPVFLLLAAFFLMVTALTYQLQGWLASLMSNPRRRRTVVVATTAIFVLVVQLPNLLNFLAPWGARRQLDRSARIKNEIAKINHAYEAGEFNAQELSRRTQEVMEDQRHFVQKMTARP